MHDLLHEGHARSREPVDGLVHDVARLDARAGPLVPHTPDGRVPPAVKNPRSALAGVLVAALSYASVAGADPITRAEVERALQGYEQGASVDTVRAWGSAGVRALIAVSRDADQVIAVRARALHALRAFSADADARAHLRAVAASDADLFLVRASFDALVEGFDDVATVARFLADPRVDVRDGAAWSLAASRNPEARTALRDRLRVETDVTVRRTLTDALAATPAAPLAPAVTVTVAPPAAPSQRTARPVRTARGR